MASLLEEIARRAQMLPPALAFPDWMPPAAAPPVEDEARLPRLSDLPQTLLPPHLRTQKPAFDANSPAVQAALGMIPGGPAIPPNFRVHTGAGNLPPGVGGQGAGMPMMEPLDTAPPPPVAPAAAIPLPRARPVIEEPAPVDEVSSRGRPAAPVGAPVPLAPPPALAPQLDQAAAAAGGAGMMPGIGDILGRIRNTLGDNSNTLLALGAGFAGAPNIGQGISRAAAASIPARAADINQSLARQTRGVTTKALIEAGVPIQQAIAASSDPELKKALIKNYIEDRAGKIVELGQDDDGRKVMGTFDPYTKQIEPINVRKLLGRPETATGDADVTGPEYLAHLRNTDPAYARTVEAIVNGDAPLPTGKTALTPRGARLVKDVMTVEPGLSASDFSNRQATSKAYSSGIESRITRSINTTLHHAATLEKAINDLDNFNTLPGILNPARAAVAGQTNPAYQKARAAYQTAVANFAKELDFVVSGGRTTVSGTKHQMEGFDPNAAKTTQLEKLRTGVELLKGRLDAHATGYGKAMKKRAEPTDFVDPDARELYDRLMGDGGHGSTPAAKPAVPKVPVGKKVVIQTPNGPVTIERVAE